MSDPAVFLDRDETLIEDPGFIRDPAQVRLQPGVAAAVGRFRAAGYKVVVVTNQSGIARGLITEDQLTAVHARLKELVRQRGLRLDGIYHCPYLDGPEAVVEAYRKNSELRKPNPGMLLQAAKDLDLDLARSWMIGDRTSDVEAGHRAGCRTIRLLLGKTATDNGSVEPSFRAETLVEAARIVEQHTSKRTTPTDQRSSASGSEVASLLAEIRDLLDRRRRLETQEDFSFLRLFGTLCQMLAIVAGCWGVVTLFGTSAGSATAQFALAIFLQLLTVTITMAERRE